MRHAVLPAITMLALSACADVGVETAGRGAESIAESACLSAVAGQTGGAGVSVLSSDFSEAGTQVMVSVEGAEAPWSCLASNDGVVESVEYSGSEGAL